MLLLDRDKRYATGYETQKNVDSETTMSELRPK